MTLWRTGDYSQSSGRMEAPPVPHEIAKTALVPVTAEAFNIPKAIDMRSRLSLLVLCFAVLSFRPVFT
ncbi:MAG: hypothetical protein WBW88_06775, partial [Rhodothermales bacterium]